MATRLYYTFRTGTPVSPAFDADWEETSFAIRRGLLLSKNVTGALGTNYGETNVGVDEDILVFQSISPPLDKAQTIGGVGKTVESYVEGFSINWDAMMPYAIVRVFSEDGLTLRGTVITGLGPSSLFPQGPTSASSLSCLLIDPSNPTAAVAAQNRDRIVVEVGARPDSSGGSPLAPPWDVTLTFGRPSSIVDITAEGQKGKVPWIEFSQNLDFVEPNTFPGTLLNRRTSPLESGLMSGSIALAHSKSITDTLALTDVMSVVETEYETFTDTVALTDSMSVDFTTTKTFTDTVALTDSMSVGLTYTRTITDTLALTDVMTSSEVEFVTISDTLALTDVMSAVEGLTKTFSDTLALTDSMSVTRHTLLVAPLQDTLRGGATIILSSTFNLSDKSLDQTLKSTSLPAGWIEATSGGVTVAQRKGLLCEVGNEPSSHCIVVPSSGYGPFFDIQVTASAEMLAGTLPSATSTNHVAALFVSTPTYTCVSDIQFIRGAFYAVATISSSAATLKSGSIFLGTDVRDTSNTNLRVICGRDRAWVSAGSLPLASVILPGLSTEVKSVQLRTFNDTGTGGAMSARYTNYQVRSHTLIADRLIDDPTYHQPHEIVAKVPAAIANNLFDFDDLGTVDVEAFGPWGYLLNEDGFEYIKPVMKTLSGGVGTNRATLNLITDPIIRSDS